MFFEDDDRRHYLGCLNHAVRKYGCRVHAYVLMDNHVHLLITPGTGRALSHTMQWVAARYVRWMNDRLERTGTLWESRFRSSAITSPEYLLACYRYIELNPVRAGMVTHPGEHAWSSYGRNALGMGDGLVIDHEIYTQLSPSKSARLAAYRALFGRPLSESLIGDLRDGIQRREMAGRAPRRRGRPLASGATGSQPCKLAN